MHRNKSVSVHDFTMVPRADIPRSSFRMEKALKTAFDSGFLVPILCEEVLPGDTVNAKLTAFARLATPIFPFMDNLHFETFFFFCPNRLVWDNWQRFMGERDPDPDSSIDYVIPKINATTTWDIGTIFDYFGLPVQPQLVSEPSLPVNVLPLRMYNLIYNEWFRDENLQDSVIVDRDDGPDPSTNYTLLRRGKRKDYFTGALPFLQKGTAVPLPLGTTAPVIPLNTTGPWGSFPVPTFELTGGPAVDTPFISGLTAAGVTNVDAIDTGGALQDAYMWTQPALQVDLSEATSATINQIRQAFQIQKLLERDARGGTRYTELVRSHFGVMSPDARLQRPEYIGGGHTPIQLNAIAQTSESSATPQGNLAAMGQMLAHGHSFKYSATEHGYIIGLCNVRADLTYQQGLRRHWSRNTRYDYYWPVFAMLGEQAILSREIFCTGENNPDLDDNAVFGYQERWAEYRYNPSEITGLMRSYAPTTIDQWHLAQEFATRPVLNAAFISENPPLDRVIAVGAEADGQQLIADMFYQMFWARPMPMYSVPGLVDHF